MQLHDVHQGIHKYKKRKRIGRGTGSGHGKTAGKGHKGHSSRQGFKYEPAVRGRPDAPGPPRPQARLRQRRFKKDYAIVNLEELDVFEAGAVSTRRRSGPAGSSRAATTTASRSSATARSPRP